MNYDCFNLFDVRNLQEQVEKGFCYQKLFWPFTVWTNCSCNLRNFAKSRPSASNFKSFSRLLEHFFLTVGQNNSGNKIPFLELILWAKTPPLRSHYSPIMALFYNYVSSIFPKIMIFDYSPSPPSKKKKRWWHHLWMAPK